MTYGVFFSIEAIGRTVDADNPESCPDTSTILELLACLSTDGDFFGLVDEQNRVLQVRFEDVDLPYWLEIPRPDLGGSYGAHFSYEGAMAILGELPSHFPEEGFPMFEFLSWH